MTLIRNAALIMLVIAVVFTIKMVVDAALRRRRRSLEAVYRRERALRIMGTWKED